MGLEKINELKKQKGLTNLQLAQMTGLTISTVDKITSGYNTNPKLGTVEAICKAVGCTISDLLDENPNNNTAHTPLKYSPKEDSIIKKYRTLDEYGKEAIDSLLDIEYTRCTAVIEEENPEIIQIKLSQLPASAGTGVDLCEENYQIMSIKASDLARQADFAVRVSGDSMETTFYDGDILLIESMPFINKGDIGIFVLNGDGYVKEYGGDRLISHNKKYPDIRLTEHDVVICSGRVIGVLEEDDFIN